MTKAKPKKPWAAVACAKYCDNGQLGMDNCNICGRTGSQFLYIPTSQRYPNTKSGWKEMCKDHPDCKDFE